jgi:hypothetical protein
MPSATTGDAILRIALAGADGGNGTAPSVAGNLSIGVNGQTVGTLHPVATNALRYNTDKGVWNQYVQKFDASLLKPGENSVTFTVPAGDVTTGVVWDYLRLELNDGSKAYPTAPDSGRPDAPVAPPLTTAPLTEATFVLNTLGFRGDGSEYPQICRPAASRLAYPLCLLSGISL